MMINVDLDQSLKELHEMLTSAWILMLTLIPADVF